jgi:predicted ATPase
MIGLTGANDTGKTTLAKAFAQAKDIPFVQTSGSAVFKMLGLDPSKDYPIEERLAIQEAILQAFEIQYADATARTPLWISDRTPIDLASYMLADVSRETLAGKPGLARMIDDYKKRCIASANRFFSVVVLVQPGIPLTQNRPGKAPSCPAFMEHLNHLQFGLMKDESVHFKNFYIPRRYTELSQRVECLTNAVSSAIVTHQARMLELAPMMH